VESRTFRAPGRVNLMGDHTDYNEGFVLPMAIDREVVVRAVPRDDGRVRVRSDGHPGVVDVAADGSDEPRAVRPAWGRLPAAVVRACAGVGAAAPLDAELASTVPEGSGLSSSAAVEVALALALADAAGAELEAVDVARLCQAAEQVATGVPSGIMDQLTSVAGVAEAALLMKEMIENTAALLTVGAIFAFGFVVLTLPLGLFFGWLGKRLAVAR
jgi:galactokinase